MVFGLEQARVDRHALNILYQKMRRSTNFLVGCVWAGMNLGSSLWMLILERLVGIFQVCVVLPHQACAGGSVFFRRRLSKAGLSGPAGQPAARAQPDARHGIVGPRSPKGAAGPKPADKPMRHAMGRPKEAWAPARRIR